jgi:serine/threonine protein kinase
LNQRPDSANVLFLRRCKAYGRNGIRVNTENPSRGRTGFIPEIARAYFDYAPYGELEDLLNKFTAFDKHLPEAFIWHVFHSLARAVLVMNAEPWERLEIDDDGDLENFRLRDEVFLNHFDMKPGNVFLGFNATEQSTTTNADAGEWHPDREYPQILLADFGLAALLTRDNKGQDRETEASYTNTLIHTDMPDYPNPLDVWNNSQGRVYGPESNPLNAGG